jgi:hypothetical protein
MHTEHQALRGVPLALDQRPFFKGFATLHEVRRKSLRYSSTACCKRVAHERQVQYGDACVDSSDYLLKLATSLGSAHCGGIEYYRRSWKERAAAVRSPIICLRLASAWRRLARAVAWADRPQQADQLIANGSIASTARYASKAHLVGLEAVHGAAVERGIKSTE